MTDEYLRLFNSALDRGRSPQFYGKYVQVSDVGFLPQQIPEAQSPDLD